jgi:hypothetical protein
MENFEGKCILFFIDKFIRLILLLQNVTVITAMKVQVVINCLENILIHHAYTIFKACHSCQMPYLWRNC